MNYFLNFTNKNIVKSFYNYTLNDKIEQNATIYRTNTKSKKIIMFISGGYSLGKHYYINKVMNDLYTDYENIIENYELICYEKWDKTNFDIYEDVYNYISYLDNDINKIEELILIGFSYGGIIASHIMSKCKNMNCKKKIITYDTPMQIYDNFNSFKNNWIYRHDILFYHKIIDIYSRHYNYNEIKHHLIKKKWNNNITEIVKLIQDIHNISFDKVYELFGFNFDLSSDTIVCNIYSKKDPIIIREISDDYIIKNKDKINFTIKNIEKNTTGHCTDMAFSTNYLKYIINAIYSK